MRSSPPCYVLGWAVQRCQMPLMALRFSERCSINAVMVGKRSESEVTVGADRDRDCAGVR